MENLDCPELIEQFEAKLAESAAQKRRTELETSSKKKKIVDLRVRDHDLDHEVLLESLLTTGQL